VIRSLIYRGADLNVECNDFHEDWGDVKETPLLMASRNGILESARVLLQHGADANFKEHSGWTPLHIASRHPFDDLAQSLLDHGANPNASNTNGITPLHEASSSRYSSILARM